MFSYKNWWEIPPLDLDKDWEIPLNKDVLQQTLFGYLEPSEAKTLAKASTPFFSTCKRQLVVLKLLRYVACGDQLNAEYMLKKDKSLLLCKGHMTDYSNRTFYNITAFQYALWALDRHMWDMLLRYMPHDKALLQLEEFESSHGVEYRKSTSQIIREKHFDFKILLKALKEFASMINVNPIEKRKTHWCTVVGNAQRNVPAHVANEYCQPGREQSYPMPNQYKEKSLERVLGFYHFNTKSQCFWFDKGLGVDFALSHYLSQNGRWFCGGGSPPYLDLPSSNKIKDDVRCLYKLSRVRMQEFVTLKRRLRMPVEEVVHKYSGMGCHLK